MPPRAAAGRTSGRKGGGACDCLHSGASPGDGGRNGAVRRAVRSGRFAGGACRGCAAGSTPPPSFSGPVARLPGYTIAVVTKRDGSHMAASTHGAVIRPCRALRRPEMGSFACSSGRYKYRRAAIENRLAAARAGVVVTVTPDRAAAVPGHAKKYRPLSGGSGLRPASACPAPPPPGRAFPPTKLLPPRGACPAPPAALHTHLKRRGPPAGRGRTLRRPHSRIAVSRRSVDAHPVARRGPLLAIPGQGGEPTACGRPVPPQREGEVHRGILRLNSSMADMAAAASLRVNCGF